MLFMFQLTLKSIKNRKFTAILTTLTIALSVCLLIGVQKIRYEAKNSFTNTISGTDLIVGARSGSIQLLLYSVFRIGNATNNLSWESYLDIQQNRKVKWAVPLSLGDSHKGFRVLGTRATYFEHYLYQGDKALEFTQGKPFKGVFDAVIGAEVAKILGYQLQDNIVISHGAGEISFSKHDNMPFTVTGILKKTGTPVDQTIHVSLSAIEAIHVGWESGASPRHKISAEQALKQDLAPKTITAVMLGLHRKHSIFSVMRSVNEYPEEPLLAIMPGIALQELWQLVGVAEQALLVISGFVVLTGLMGMLTVILSSLNERRREMAILRSVGARPWQIATLLVSEAFIFTLLGILFGIGLLYGLLWILQPWMFDQFGLYMPMTFMRSDALWVLLSILCMGLVIGLIPGYRAYKTTLTDGLTIKV